jgi:cyclic pyranopterin phosphate synthase
VAGLIRGLAGTPGVSEVSLSTNGMLLSRLAADLARAGLRRVNVSLDTLRPERFGAIARGGELRAVWEGIAAAVAAGLSPLKINVVVARGMNEDEVADFARLTEDRPLHVRFIELMPMGETGFFSQARLVSEREILERASPVEPLPRGEWPSGRGPARYYRRPGALGTIGIISALGCGFCDSCNRMRLSAAGVLYPCLDSRLGVDLARPLRAGLGPEALRSLIQAAVRLKPERHTMRERVSGPETPRTMCQIGG